MDWPSVLWFGLPGMAGAWVGASVATWVPGPVQLATFAGVMLLAAWRMLRRGIMQRRDRIAPRIKVVAGGAGVGLLSGLVGVGGGFLIVPALVLLAGVPMGRAVGTSLAVIALNSFAGFARYLPMLEAEELEPDWTILFLITAIGTVGSFAGHRLGRRLPQAALRRIFGVFLFALSLLIALEVAPRLL